MGSVAMHFPTALRIQKEHWSNEQAGVSLLLFVLLRAMSDWGLQWTSRVCS